MPQLVDCPSCGGLLPADRPCCPHCHCKTPRWRRAVWAIAAVIGLGSQASCLFATVEYGPAMIPDGGFGGGSAVGGGTGGGGESPDGGSPDGGNP
jgi:hypothetical protein